MSIDGLPLVNIGATGLLALVFLMVITDKLVWHRRLRAAEERGDRWESIALTALGVADKLTVQAEVTNEVLTRLPDPAEKEGPT